MKTGTKQQQHTHEGTANMQKANLFDRRDEQFKARTAKPPHPRSGLGQSHFSGEERHRLRWRSREKQRQRQRQVRFGCFVFGLPAVIDGRQRGRRCHEGKCIKKEKKKRNQDPTQGRTGHACAGPEGNKESIGRTGRQKEWDK